MSIKSKKKVLIIGLPYFAKKLATHLSEFNPENIFIPLDTNKKFVDKIKYAIHIINSDTIYQIGGNAYLGGALRLAYFLKKRIVFHWVGTDVLMAKENFRLKTANVEFVNYVEHLCEVDWIKDELLELNISPQIMQIACIDQQEEASLTFPKTFSVLTYMTPGREKFYGLDLIIDLANQVPDVSIKILGISSCQIDLPKNIIIGGWVQDMKKEYLASCLYLRLPEHDGLSFSVLEALSYGRHVGYSQKLKSTEFIENAEALIFYVKKLKLLHKEDELELNKEGLAFIKQNFQKIRVVEELESYLTK